ncbi:RNA polymerase sigma factor [Marinicella litoralis]|uniref:RNA polymerase sigma factor (Sigma-70 family) n=1 Tax=Marinicella litoralis TaxID=644220 RepID=A0A4R6XTB2_9GAMM|nr:sigma-70 family RNA polymerase sigma factor [Marinicella litoralis]TDR23192.1 RNA polymerase sigma factor (sigma-70 family) [Marinicella litoralis]
MKKRKLDQIFLQHQHLIEKAVYSKKIQISGITADDVFQEVSIRLFKVLESDRQIENLSSYIYRTTANVIVDLARKQNRHLNDIPLPDQQNEEQHYRADLISQESEPDQQLIDNETQMKVLQAIESLPESRRIAIKMRLQGYSVKEMVELTGWPYYKAENLSKRSMAALKEKLKLMNIDYEIN